MNLYNYIAYIEYLNQKLGDFFREQQPYICCKKGCAKCCKQGTYPFSQLEFRYLMFGFNRLAPETKNIIRNKILNIIEEKITFEGEKFMYECPFLINNSCSVYEFRGIICRLFGLMYFEENKEASSIPFCAFEGLNYANVIDTTTKTISAEKFKNSGLEQEPLAYNVSYKFLTNENHQNEYGIEFGERKQLIDLLIQEFKLQ